MSETIQTLRATEQHYRTLINDMGEKTNDNKDAYDDRLTTLLYAHEEARHEVAQFEAMGQVALVSLMDIVKE